MIPQYIPLLSSPLCVIFISYYYLSYFLSFFFTFFHSRVYFFFSSSFSSHFPIFAKKKYYLTLFSFSPTHFLYFLTINFPMYFEYYIVILHFYTFLLLISFHYIFLIPQLSQLHIILFFLLFIHSHRFCLSIKMNFDYSSHMFFTFLSYSSYFFLSF